ncbi:hypothetical protein [Pseudoxanthomonas sp. PXM02]|jgi:hypothetical protein|uniref:hypothetical protein n=1 Tax=Pseudoxanthomonas sp. PXM02 TaxID=2769294 RepID=UPI0017839DC3|nr:hypothetical protein [Pseudoxanthomonas sp. PXM02]MBD9478122.1 hypothetical protein [Pseudoxanthomonas sp. PXM02]
MHDPTDPVHDELIADDAVVPYERRDPTSADDPVALRSGLSRAQLDTLDTMESFQWRLGFVRWPVFKAPIPVLFNRDGSRYVVIREDGSIDEHPALQLRD